MDAKITKERLGRMLSYDWIKIIGLAVAAIVVWVLIFTVTATRITPAQQFTVMNYIGNNALSDGFSHSYNNAFKSGVFSYEVIELSSPVDLAANEDYAATLLEARTATEEGDVMFVANVTNPDSVKKDAEGNVTESSTYLETLIKGRSYYFYKIDDYLNNMEDYLAKYYVEGDWEDGQVNEQLVEKDFRARVKKDKRYKKESQIKKGVQDDVERIEKYAEALEKFYWYEEQGVVSRTSVVLDEEKELAYNYAINLCPQKGVDENGQPYYPMENLKSLVSYQEETEIAEGETTSTKDLATAKNMNVCLFNFKGVAAGFEYESLLYVVYLIDTNSSVIYPNA